MLSTFSCSSETLEDWIQLEEKQCLNLTQLESTLEPALEIKCWEFLQVRISLLIKQYPASPENTVRLTLFEYELNCSTVQYFVNNNNA